eukprot:6343032-Prymnesium_polylepis.1
MRVLRLRSGRATPVTRRGCIAPSRGTPPHFKGVSSLESTRAAARGRAAAAAEAPSARAPPK